MSSMKHLLMGVMASLTRFSCKSSVAPVQPISTKSVPVPRQHITKRSNGPTIVTTSLFKSPPCSFEIPCKLTSSFLE